MRIKRLLTCALFMTLPSVVWAQNTPPPTVAVSETDKLIPVETTVAILPVIDRTGEKVVERRQRQEWTGYYNIAEMFFERGFRIADPDAVQKAITEQDLDLQDEESYRRDNFYKVAQAVKADLVVFIAITDTSQDVKSSGLFGRRNDGEVQGRAKVKMWFLNEKTHKAIFSAVTKEGNAAGRGGGFDTNIGTRRRANAVGNAVKEELEDWTNDYPKKTTNGLDDWSDLIKAQALYNHHDNGEDKKEK